MFGSIRLAAVMPVLCPCALIAGNVVTDWNETALQAIRNLGTPPPVASRALAITHAAIYDAVNSASPTGQAYRWQLNTAPGTSVQAAAAQAAHDALTALFPSQSAAFSQRLNEHLSGIIAGAGRDAGVQLGQSVAAAMLAVRAGDGSSTTLNYTPQAAGTPGAWQETGNGAFLLPQWGSVTRFAPGAVLPVVSPPALDSPAYAAAFLEVAALGSASSSVRTPEQTAIAYFWADGPGTATPPGHWNSITQSLVTTRSLGLEDSARLFARLNLATADAAMEAWDAKLDTDLWRPILGIRQAGIDGNIATMADPSWSPLITTPPFPAFVSGHSTFSGAAAAVLEDFFGTDDVTFSTTTDSLLVDAAYRVRDFDSFSEAAAEAGMSRIYGGIHWQFDNTGGLALGRAVGQHAATLLGPTPVPELGTMASVLLASLGVTLWRRR